jgi:hypothetical protein
MNKINNKTLLKNSQRINLKLVGVFTSLAIIAGIVAFFGINFSNIQSKGSPGLHGAKSITTGTVILNEFTTLTSNASAGHTTINVSNSRLNSNSRFSGNLAAGELILIIQMQGATIGTSNDATYGNISNYNNCGKYEFAQVARRPNNTSVELTTGLKNSYTSSGKVQVIRVPRYTSLSLSAGATITTRAWDGSTGGIIALEVSGTSTINGTIDASAMGFTGGTVDQNTSTNVTSYRSTSSSNGAEKGESIAGLASSLSNGQYGRGAPANGGGGGNANNAGGGGGANAGTGTWNGLGNPQNPNSNWTTAWNLEGASFSANTSPGGGRGGYSWSNTARNPLTTGPNNSTWTGDSRANVGGLGGRVLDYSNGRVFMGGGGGAGDSNNNNGTSGGEGGGIIFINAGGNISGTGIIQSNGESVPATGTTGNGDGGGGGGGGGTIIVHTKNATISNLTINAIGGQGGNHAIASANYPETEGPGGSGGGGYIALSSSSNITFNVVAGTAGTSNSTVYTNFAANGATRGGTGISNGTAPTNPYSGTNTLPIELINFSGKIIGNSIELNWSTASEINNDYFEIERSTNGIDFKHLAEIDGGGTTHTLQRYTYTDKRPYNGVNYYRLKQLDTDGKFENFGPVVINNSSKTGVSLKINQVFPNPIVSNAEMKITSAKSGELRLTIISMNGEIIEKENFEVSSGSNCLPIKAARTLASGAYIFRIQMAGEKPSSIKVIKQ